MIAGQKHIIEKVYLEVNTTSEKSAYYIKNNVDSFLKDVLLLRLEKLLDEFDRNDKTVRFDELRLDFFIQEWENDHEILHEFENSLRKKLNKELNISQPGENAAEQNREISAAQNREDVFLFFLENGFLPWYGKKSYISELTQPDNWMKSLQSKSFREKIKTLFIQNENALKRFAMQFPTIRSIYFLKAIRPREKGLEREIPSLLGFFPEKLRFQLIEILLQLSVLKENEKIIRNLHILAISFLNSGIKTIKPEFEKAFQKLDEFVFQYYAEEKEMVSKVQTIIENYRLNKLNEYLKEWKNALKPAIDEEEKKAKQTNKKQDKKPDDFFFDEEKPTEIIVQNAGLVLLHPFLKTFFTEAGILNENGNFYKEKHMHAVQALHFLATGNETFFEANMILEKFLVGLPLKMPVQRESFLTDEIKTEANEMLRQVIKNWPALKNTSVDGLRQNFLQRDGKLLQTENGFKLIVERKTQDILLEKLGWNISVVKFPWKERILFIEW